MAQRDPQMQNPSTAQTVAPATSVPLFVDLDGTLIKSDLLIESVLALIRQAPHYLLWLPFWLMQGAARLKAEVARRVALPVDGLPLQRTLLDYIAQARRNGRPVYLATAADHRLAKLVADKLGLFTGVLASDATQNLKGEKKLEAIRRQSEGAFDYAGNALCDIPIWAQARRGLVVNAMPFVAQMARRRCEVEAVWQDRPSAVGSWLRALRLYQWTKNLLLGVPLVTAHAFSLEKAGLVALAFLAFGLVASAAYVFNDLLDLASDRAHARKRRRPFAAGDLPLGLGLAAVGVCAAAGFGIAMFLPRAFTWALLSYAVLTLSYSLYFKTLALLDVILLGALYTARIIAGAAAIEVEVSFWLLAFSMFVFLSIALLKRSAELATVNPASQAKIAGRDYRRSDFAELKTMGIASGYLSVLVLSLYIDSPGVVALYAHPSRLWALCPLMLYWISRLWIKTSRGEMHDDPLMFSLKDRASWLVLAGMTLTMWSAM